MDDQVNRSLRPTLILKGVNEENNETWEATEEIVKSIINRHLKVGEEQACDMIERAHRGGSKQSGRSSSSKNGPRYIFVKFHSWKDSEMIKSGFADLNAKNRSMAIRVNQMFSKRLTVRRNNAMLKRKQLLESKCISSGYIAYPANLMVKKSPSEKGYKRFMEF